MKNKKCGKFSLFSSFRAPGSASYTPAAQSGYVTPTHSYATTTQQQRTTGYDQSQYASQTYASEYFSLSILKPQIY